MDRETETGIGSSKGKSHGECLFVMVLLCCLQIRSMNQEKAMTDPKIIISPPQNDRMKGLKST